MTTQLGEKAPPGNAAPPDVDAPPTILLNEHEAAIAERDVEIAALSQQVEDLTAAKDELATLKQAQAEAETAQRRDTLKSFAQAYGLDAEAEQIAQAIESLDYETIVAAAADQSDKQSTRTAARPMADIAVDAPYGGILDKTNQ